MSKHPVQQNSKVRTVNYPLFRASHPFNSNFVSNSIGIKSKLASKVANILVISGILCLDAILHDESKRHDLSNNVPLVTSDKGSELQNAWLSFCQRGFWTRVWILQEMALGNDVILQAGSRTTKLEYFLAIFCLNYARVRATAIDRADLRRHKDNAKLMANVYGDAYDLIHCIFRSMQEPRDLETLIYDTQLLQAENNLDKIYALLGLATNKEELNVKPDYKKSFEDGCRDLSNRLVLKRGTRAFSYTRSRLESDKISSWANIYCLLKHDPKNKIERKLMPMSGTHNRHGEFRFRHTNIHAFKIKVTASMVTSSSPRRANSRNLSAKRVSHPQQS
jgi:hypothetical protein